MATYYDSFIIKLAKSKMKKTNKVETVIIYIYI